MASKFSYGLVDSYIYFYHTDEYLILPMYPEQVSDSMNVTFSPQTALGRTAPVQSYSNSGPRTVQFNIQLHRDIMNDLNTAGSNIRINNSGDIITNITDDYVDILIKKLQSLALPKFDASNKTILPPRVAVRFGSEIFCKGIISGSIGVDYRLPLLSNNKYAQAALSFTITETTPYDAETVSRLGSFRGLTSGLKQKISDIQNTKTSRG